MGFLTGKEVYDIGFKKVELNIKISSKAFIYGALRIEVGDHVRIDDFLFLSVGEKGIVLGSYMHIACFYSLIGNKQIAMEDFSLLSSRVALYSSIDDYSAKYLTHPMVPEHYNNVKYVPIYIEKHVVIGISSIILYKCRIGLGVNE